MDLSDLSNKLAKSIPAVQALERAEGAITGAASIPEAALAKVMSYSTLYPSHYHYINYIYIRMLTCRMGFQVRL